MAFGDSIWPSNIPAPILDTNATSYAGILTTAAKGAWTEVIAAAAVTAECHFLWVDIYKTAIASTDTSATLDIGVGLPGAITGVASTDIITSTAHGMAVNDQMSFKTITGGTGLTITTNYFVIAANLTANTFQLSTTLGGGAVNFTTDITAGTAYRVIILDLFAGFADDHNAGVSRGGGRHYEIPIKIISGSSVAIRGRTATGTNKGASIAIQLAGGPTGSPYSGATCVTLGVTGTGGTAITPGNDATWSSWVSVGGTTDRDLQAVILGVQPALATLAREAYEFQIGISSAAISPIFSVFTTTEESVNTGHSAGLVYYFVASGTQLQVRARGVSGSINAQGVALYGVSAT